MAILRDYYRKPSNSMTFMLNSSHCLSRSAGKIDVKKSITINVQQQIPPEFVYLSIAYEDGGKTYGYGSNSVGVASIVPPRIGLEKCDPAFFDECENTCLVCVDGYVRKRVRENDCGICIHSDCIPPFNNIIPIWIDPIKVFRGPCFKSESPDCDKAIPIEHSTDLCKKCSHEFYLPPNRLPRTELEFLEWARKTPTAEWIDKCPEGYRCEATRWEYINGGNDSRVVSVTCLDESKCWTRFLTFDPKGITGEWREGCWDIQTGKIREGICCKNGECLLCDPTPVPTSTPTVTPTITPTVTDPNDPFLTPTPTDTGSTSTPTTTATATSTPT